MSTNIQSKVSLWESLVAKAHQIVHGGSTESIETDGGLVRSFAKLMSDKDAEINNGANSILAQALAQAQAAAISASEALGYLQAYRASSYGALASDPALDPLGNAPTVGDEYFNTTANLLKRFNGSIWQASDVSTANLAEAAGSSLVTYAHPGVGSVGRTLREKLSESVSVADFMTTAQKADVRARTGMIDCLPAFAAAIAAVTEQGPFVYPVSGEILVPSGLYFLSGTLTLSSGVRLKGKGSGQQGGNYASVLKFPLNTPGIVGIKANTGPNTNGADASIIEGIFLQGGGGTNLAVHGVDMQTRMKLCDVTVSGFAGNGINIVADVAQRKNANCWVLDTVAVLFNGVNGIYTQGGDANAGYAHGIDASNNGAFGINDGSFLGNTYIGCHTDGNGKKSLVSHENNRYYCLNGVLAGATAPGTNTAVWALIGAGGVDGYRPAWVSGATYLVGGAYAATGQSARNLFLGCYSESGSQPPSVNVGNNLFIGGLLASGFTPGSSGLRFVDGKVSRLSTDLTASGAIVTFSAGPSNEVLTLTDPSSARNYPYRLKYTTGKWVMDWGNGAQWLHLYNRDATPANGFARDLSNSSGGIGLPNGYYGGYMRYRAEGESAPASGNYLSGDIIYNVVPAPGGFVGWICTTSGAPGIWKTFGAISA